MASAENALVARLLATTGVTDIISDRIDPFPLPQNPVRPALTYHKVSGFHFHSLQGSSGLAKPHVQIDCWADPEDEAGLQALAEQVRLSLQGFRGTVGGENLQAVLLVDEMDIYEEEDEGLRTALIFEVWICESIPP